MMPRILSTSLLLAVVLAAQPAVAEEAGCVALKGSLLTERSFNRNGFTGIPYTEITETRNVSGGQQKDALQVKYRGVLLRDLLNAAAFQEKERHDFRKTLIVATARDGYVALFSWGELFNSKLGEQVLVITDIDGKPLPDAEGPCALRSLGDLRPGPRHVKWLKQIEVVRVGQ